MNNASSGGGWSIITTGSITTGGTDDNTTGTIWLDGGWVDGGWVEPRYSGVSIDWGVGPRVAPPPPPQPVEPEPLLRERRVRLREANP